MRQKTLTQTMSACLIRGFFRNFYVVDNDFGLYLYLSAFGIKHSNKCIVFGNGSDLNMHILSNAN